MDLGAVMHKHGSSLIYPLKYYYRGQAPDYSGVPIIVQLRRMATVLSRQGEIDSPKTREELRALNKWLDW